MKHALRIEISGAAGAGKSHLAVKLRAFLRSQGYVVDRYLDAGAIDERSGPGVVALEITREEGEGHD